GGPLLVTDGLTFPSRIDLLGICEGYLDWVVAAPLVSWAGPYAASNVASFLHYAMLAGGVFVLCRTLSGSAWAAATAAILLLLSPSVMHEFGEGRAVVGSLGLAALALSWSGRWVVSGRHRYLAGVLLALPVTMVGYLHAGPMLAMLLPCLAIGYVLRGRPAAGGSRAWLVRGGLLALVLAALAFAALAFARRHVADVGLPTFNPGLLRGSAYRSWYMQGISGGLPLRDLVLPMPLARQAGSGAVLPLFALIALAAPRSLRPTLPWWIGAGVLHFAAMGTTLSIHEGGGIVGSPYRYLPAVFPFLLRFYWPHRYLLVGDICLAVLVAIGLVAVGRRWPRSRWRPAGVFSVGAVGLALAQAGWTWPFTPTDPDRMPDVVYRLAEDRPGAVLEISAGANGPGASWDRFHYDRFEAAIVHGAPMCCQELPVRLAPRSFDSVVYRTPVLAWMLEGKSTDAARTGDAVPIEAWGYTHLVLHGHGCTGAVRPLDDFGPDGRWLADLRDAGSADAPASAAQAARGRHGPGGGGRRERGPERTCDLVVAMLADIYGPPIASEPTGDGLVALWSLPRTPLLPADEPRLWKDP
ncbi:MAG: hypothetical protein JXB39_00520, partial [Deltaproteobacteria bacterium]|nr:hypothetical protein [Deltaproteobacteria bacterium]